MICGRLRHHDGRARAVMTAGAVMPQGFMMPESTTPLRDEASTAGEPAASNGSSSASTPAEIAACIEARERPEHEQA